jgi:hypothetical protein
LSKPRSAPAKGIRVTFSEQMWFILEKWDTRNFHDDHIHNGAPPSSYGSAYEGRLGLYHAFTAAKRSGTGYSMMVSPVVLDYLCDNFVPFALDMIDAGGGEWEDRTGRSLWAGPISRFGTRMKALRSAQQSA